MNKRYVVAVSGGVDSIVLLDKLVHTPGLDLVVAHFDHGIRDDSSDDARFVQQVARDYGLPCEVGREELGKQASEELARNRRYEFLRSVATKHHARIATAHHADDIIETIAINLTRGTGWRGLAVLDSDIYRPLLDMSKSEIIDYAKSHNLIWHEDSTNASDAYLRNRLRQKAGALTDDIKRQLLALRAQQTYLKQDIDDEVKNLVSDGPEHSRYFYTHIDPLSAGECLRAVTSMRLTRPQLHRSLHMIKTARPGTSYQAGSGVEFRFTSRNFIVELIK